MSEKSEKGGVQFDMISRERMEGLRTMEKVRLILDSVQDGKIVILEGGLTSDEEGKLVEVTMDKIDPETGFSGIDIETYPSESNNDGIRNKLAGWVSKEEKDDTSLVLIGPAEKIQTVHKDESLISAFVSND